MLKPWVWIALFVLTLSPAFPARADFRMGMMIYTDLDVYYRDTERMRIQNPGVPEGVYDVFPDMPNQSRICSKYTTEECGGYFETGAGDGVEPSGVGFTDTKFRKLYAWYEFGHFRLEAGQMEPLGAARFNPTQLFGLGHSQQIILAGWGNLYDRTPQVNLVYDRGPFYAGVGVGTDNPFGMFRDGEECNPLPRVFIAAGVKTDQFSIQPNFTFQQAEAENTSGKGSAVYGYVLEVPVVVQRGRLGAKLSGHWGLNVGDVYARYYNLGYSGQQANGKVRIKEDGGVEDTICWGGYFDVSFGDKPLAIHVIGGLQHVQNSLWKNKDSNTRWTALLRIPYTVQGSFTVSPELAYYSFGDDIRTPAGQPKDLGTEWLAGIQFQFAF